MQHEVVGIKDRFIEWQFPVPTIEMDTINLRPGKGKPVFTFSKRVKKSVSSLKRKVLTITSLLMSFTRMQLNLHCTNWSAVNIAYPEKKVRDKNTEWKGKK